jgi:hypothetical protein
MFLRSCFALLGVAALLVPFRAAEPDLADNAALKYWRAFDVLPTFTADDEKILAGADKAARSAFLKKQFDARSLCLDHLHRGAKLARCDWGCDWEEGIGVLMPHLQKARQTTRLAVLRAEYYFETGKPDDAIDDLLAVWALARHVGREPTLLSVLVQYAIEAIAMETAAQYLPTLNAAQRKHLTDGLATLPRGAGVRSAIIGEKKIFLPWLLKETTGDWSKSEHDVVKQMMKSLPAGVDVRAVLAELGTHYDRMAAFADLSQKDAKKAFDELTTDAKKNPFSANLLPAIDKVMEAQDRTRARWALFDAAIKVVGDGPDAVAKTRDPFGDGPFVYHKTEGGFELQSQLKSLGKAVSVMVGQKK